MTYKEKLEALKGEFKEERDLYVTCQAENRLHDSESDLNPNWFKIGIQEGIITGLHWGVLRLEEEIKKCTLEGESNFDGSVMKAETKAWWCKRCGMVPGNICSECIVMQVWNERGKK